MEGLQKSTFSILRVLNMSACVNIVRIMFASFIGPQVQPVCRPLVRRILAAASFNFVLTFFVRHSRMVNL